MRTWREPVQGSGEGYVNFCGARWYGRGRSPRGMRESEFKSAVWSNGTIPSDGTLGVFDVTLGCRCTRCRLPASRRRSLTSASGSGTTQVVQDAIDDLGLGYECGDAPVSDVCSGDGHRTPALILFANTDSLSTVSSESRERNPETSSRDI